MKDHRRLAPSRLWRTSAHPSALPSPPSGAGIGGAGGYLYFVLPFLTLCSKRHLKNKLKNIRTGTTTVPSGPIKAAGIRVGSFFHR
jgi:hypothetical protein